MIHKAESVGYSPALIGAGREINDSMGAFVASKSVKLLIRKGISVRGANALILGLTFKENCPDIRNTKVIDVYRELTEYGINVQVADSWANPEEVADQLGLRLTESFDLNLFDLIILAVPHRNYESLYKEFNATDQRVVFDLKSFWPKELTDASL
jgi:UDP-N-acetyl-D-galactosamine dehydrogenase